MTDTTKKRNSKLVLMQKFKCTLFLINNSHTQYKTLSTYITICEFYPAIHEFFKQ